MYVYSITYKVPGTADGGREAQFRGLIALGKLYPFEDGVVLPHEQTFPKVVDDRLRLLDATKTNLESIFLLYADRAGAMDRILEVHSRGEPTLRVEAKPGEFHSLHRIESPGVLMTLRRLLAPQKTIIADGHHRYTTSLKYMKGLEEAGKAIPGCGWQLMTFANLYGEGLSILATHRLVKLMGEGADERVLDSLVAKLEVSTEEAADLCLETRSRKVPARFPRAMRTARTGAGATSYGLLQDVVLGDWLAGRLEGEKGILYFKEGTGETEALLRKEGDILFRMKPVDRREFETVVQRGEVFPHKTTYFYPKLWSGLVMWRLDRVD